MGHEKRFCAHFIGDTVTGDIEKDAFVDFRVDCVLVAGDFLEGAFKEPFLIHLRLAVITRAVVKDCYAVQGVGQEVGVFVVFIDFKEGVGIDEFAVLVVEDIAFLGVEEEGPFFHEDGSGEVSLDPVIPMASVDTCCIIVK